MILLRPQLIFWLARCKHVGTSPFPHVSFLLQGDKGKPLDDKQCQARYSPVPYTYGVVPPLTALPPTGISFSPKLLRQLSFPTTSFWRFVIVLIFAFSLFIMPSVESYSQFISYQEHAFWAEKQFPFLLLLQDPKESLIYAISFRFKNLQLHLGTFPGDQ